MTDEELLNYKMTEHPPRPPIHPIFEICLLGEKKPIPENIVINLIEMSIIHTHEEPTKYPSNLPNHTLSN